MKNFVFLMAGIVAISLAANGCVSISKYTPQARPGMEDEKPVSQGKIGKAEPKIKVDVELLERPDLSRFSAPKTPDTEVKGNRGVFEGGVLMMRQDFKAQDVPVQQKPKVWWSTMPEEQPSAQVEPQAEVPQTKIIKYKVKKGQTLADVSQDVFGTTKKWKKIYEANKDKIKDPNKIYAGQVLEIEVQAPRQRLK
jgi:nucleoid-associated protein YgaU